MASQRPPERNARNSRATLSGPATPAGAAPADAAADKMSAAVDPITGSSTVSEARGSVKVGSGGPLIADRVLTALARHRQTSAKPIPARPVDRPRDARQSPPTQGAHDHG